MYLFFSNLEMFYLYVCFCLFIALLHWLEPLGQCLNGSGEKEHLCPIPNLGKEVFRVSPISKYNVIFSVDLFVKMIKLLFLVYWELHHERVKFSQMLLLHLFRWLMVCLVFSMLIWQNKLIAFSRVQPTFHS